MRKTGRTERTAVNAGEVALCGLFTALMAVGAFIQIAIPLEPVPMHFTLQFYFALLAGFVLGKEKGSLSVLVYLVLGLCGVPVFASGGGPAYLIRPTFGFLLGFPAAAWLAGFLTERLPLKGLAGRIIAAAAGMAAYYLCGMVYFYGISNYFLQTPVSWYVVLVNCFLVTVVEDSVLCVLAAITAGQLVRIKNKISGM